VGAAVLVALPRGRVTWVLLLAIVALWSVQSVREVRSWSDPVQRLERDLADGRDSVGHHDLLSWAYAERGDLSPGLSHVNKALQYATNLPRLLVRKADLLARAGNTEDAIQILNRAEKIDPTTRGLYPAYVRILIARRDFENAGRSLLRARALEPEDARLALEFAWVLRRMGQPNAALDAAAEALALDPRLPGARAEMAWARSMIDSTERQREETLRLARSDLGHGAKVQMRTWATLARLHAAGGHDALSRAASSRAESLAVALGAVQELR
jgi:tetratricopeptide (TPR) repeat protein